MSAGSIVEFNYSFCKPNFKENLALFNFFPCYLFVFGFVLTISGQPADFGGKGGGGERWERGV